MKNALIAIILALAYCASGQTFGPDVTWRGLKSAPTSMIAADTTAVITNQNDWQIFWAKLTASDGVSAPTDINWTSQEVVAVVLGNRPLGTTVMIKSIDRTRPGEVTVRYVEQPAPAGIYGNSRANPYDIVKMDRTGAVQIKFAKQTAQPDVIIGGGFGPGPSGGTSWWTTYAAEQSCLIGSANTTVIRDQSQLGNYWQALTGTPSTPADVDWNSEMLVAINLGDRTSSGYDVLIDGVSISPDGSLVVYYAEKQPAPKQHVRAGNFSPYAIIRLPRNHVGVSFQKRFFASSSG